MGMVNWKNIWMYLVAELAAAVLRLWSSTYQSTGAGGTYPNRGAALQDALALTGSETPPNQFEENLAVNLKLPQAG